DVYRHPGGIGVTCFGKAPAPCEAAEIANSECGVHNRSPVLLGCTVQRIQGNDCRLEPIAGIRIRFAAKPVTHDLRPFGSWALKRRRWEAAKCEECTFSCFASTVEEFL